MVCRPVEIRTEHHTNMSPQHYRYVIQLGKLMDELFVWVRGMDYLMNSWIESLSRLMNWVNV
jgi:hypothetical protein